MEYKHKRLSIHYSQNFLRDPELVKKLLRNSSIGPKDTVLEIGPGKGVITFELVKAASYIIAIEKDISLYESLKTRLVDLPNLELVNSDFLTYQLPKIPYKVFANIPFSISADMVRKLTQDKCFNEGFLIVQKEFAQKIVGMPFDLKNSMVAALLKPRFDITPFYKFEKSDFIPKPNVESVMIRIKRRQLPLISEERREIYQDFILYNYSRVKISKLDVKEMITLFNLFIKTASEKQKREVGRLAKRFLLNQEKIVKIHRTRNDRNWRKY